MAGEWWLDASALPVLYWAKLTRSDGGWLVRDLDGAEHWFVSRDAAVAWLRGDEYATLADLQSDGDIPSSVEPPTG